MIISFACKETQKIWNGFRSSKFPADIQDRALRKLRCLNAADNARDLREPLSNHLEYLKEDREGQMSIRVNNQWRVCFIFEDGNAHSVEIIDYH